MIGDAVTAGLTHVLVPELSPGEIIIMDNVSSHKVPIVRAAIEAVGVGLMFLSPYSLKLNQVERKFSQLRPACATPPSRPRLLAAGARQLLRRNRHDATCGRPR